MNKQLGKLREFYRGKKVVVTGGAGFVGSYLVPLLLDLGAEVTVADNLSRGQKEYLSACKNRFKFIKTDLTVLDHCLFAFKGADIIINLAARNTGISYDLGHEHEMFTENILLQLQPLRAAESLKIPYFLQVSSTVVYPRKKGVLTERDAIGEPEVSKSGYSYAKKLGEMAAIWFARNCKMKVAIARPNNIYGPRDESSITTLHVIPALTRKILRGDNPVEMFGSGKQKRQFVYVRDAAVGLLLVLAKTAKFNPEPINVTADTEYTIDEIYWQICRSLGISRPVKHNLSLPEGPKRRFVSNLQLCRLGWRPTVAFDEGIKETVDYIKAVYQNDKKKAD